jgi:hypothetical protein
MAPVPQQGYPPPYAPPYVQPYQPGYPPAPKNNGLAVASFVCGLVSLASWLTCLVGAVASIPGLVLGIIGLQRINASRGMERGRGLAIAGIATSAVSMVVTVLLVLFVAGSSSF